MKALIAHKKHAILLRQKGLTYSEIKQIVPVSQASLSLWLHDVPLSSSQKNRIDKKMSESVLLGSQIRRQKYLTETKDIISEASAQISSISARELWLIGIALYWAEGTKQKSTNISQGVKFSNSDPNMIQIFVTWLIKIIKVPLDDIIYELYIHHSMSDQISNIVNYWSQALKQPVSKFDRIYLKHNSIIKNYPRQDYRGVMRVVVKRSTNLNRQISGWQNGITNNCRVV